MSLHPKEIEMQTYSMSYSYPEVYPTSLPYHWDGDCSLTLNQTIYVPEEDRVPELPDQLFSDEENNELAKEPEPSAPLISPMHCDGDETVRQESLASLGSVSTQAAGSVSSNPSGSVGSIDEKLDFILDSVKKQKKPAVKKPPTDKKHKLTRKRKTNAQLEILQKELEDDDVMDKSRMKELAEKTGLKESQVYKWYWDNKHKQCPSATPSESHC